MVPCTLWVSFEGSDHFKKSHKLTFHQNTNCINSVINCITIPQYTFIFQKYPKEPNGAQMYRLIAYYHQMAKINSDLALGFLFAFNN